MEPQENMNKGMDMMDSLTHEQELREELDALQRRLMELEEIEVMRVSEEHERFDSLQVLDEYAKQLEESRDKLARLLRAGTAVQEARNVKEILQLVANAIGQAGWGSVSVNVFENWDVRESAYHGCTSEEIVYLETHRQSPERRAARFGPEMERFRVSRSYFVPSDHLPEIMSPDQVVPGRRPPEPGDTWDPMDLAYVPLLGTDGRVIGSINCDDPSNGQRPSAEIFFYLELFADLAARKIEAMQMQERQQRTEEALRQSEEKYRATFNRSADGFFLMDELFRDCNSKACELWRCDPEDIIGHSPVEFSPEFQPDGRRSEVAAREYIHAAMRGEPQVFYWMHKRKDGSLMDCEVSLASMQVAEESQVLAIVRDITERKRAERERETILNILKIANLPLDSDEVISRIFSEIGKLMPVENYFIAFHDPESDTISFPHFVDEKDDPPPAIPLGTGVTSWVIRNNRPLLAGPADFLRMAESGEIKLRGSTASSWLGVPLAVDGRAIGALVVQSYRTEGLFDEIDLRTLSAIAAQIGGALGRRQSEEALQFTQFAVDRAADAVLWVDREARILYANDTACAELGYSRDDLLKLTIPDLDAELQMDRWTETWESVRRNGTISGETGYHTADGRIIPMELRINYLAHNERSLLCVFARDIRDRRLAQRELTTLRKAVESSGEIVFMSDSDGTIRFVNAEFTRLYGYPPEEVIGKFSVQALTGDLSDDHGFPEVVARIRRGEIVRRQHVNRSKDGRMIHVECSASPVFDEGCNCEGILFIQRDVSQRIREEEALRNSEEGLRWLVDNFDDAVCIVDMDDVFVYANTAMERLLGVSSQDLHGRCLSEFMSAEQFAEVRRNTQARYEGVRGHYPCEIRRPDGQIRNIEIAATPQYDRDGGIRRVLASCREISAPAAVS